MKTIDINNSKSYATEANLAKGTAETDAMLDNAIARGDISSLCSVRKMPVRNAAGRWTAAYILRGDAVSYAVYIATNGFMAIG